MLHRKPKPKLTKYVINVNPVETREVALRGRVKPRKARLMLVKEFNEMIKQGIIAEPKFNEEGRMIGLGKFPGGLTDKQLLTIKRVVDFTGGDFFKNWQKPAKYLLEKKLNHILGNHQARGGFKFIHPALLSNMLVGESVEEEIRLAETRNKTKSSGLRTLSLRFDTKEKVQKNLRIMFRYFEQLLRKKRKNEMIIFEDISDFDRSTTKIKLTKNGVEQETIVQILAPPFGTIKSVVILLPNGKFILNEVVLDRQKQFNRGFR